MSANKKFIVWDWNGTLLDDTDSVLIALNAVLKKSDHAPISMETFQNTSTTNRQKFYRDVGVSEEKIDQLLESERNVFHDNYEPLADHAPLRHGAADILHHLKSNSVSSLILSNHIADQINRLLVKNGIQHHFDEVMAYSDRQNQFRHMTKGDKLRQHIDAKGLNSANAIIVGDTTEEIEIAHSLGMTSVAITGGVHSEKRLSEKNPDHLIHSLPELTRILEQREFVA